LSGAQNLFVETMQRSLRAARRRGELAQIKTGKRVARRAREPLHSPRQGLYAPDAVSSSNWEGVVRMYLSLASRAEVRGFLKGW
jgi:hypothetical protein